MKKITEGGLDVPLPEMVQINQKFCRDRISNVRAHIFKELEKPNIREKFKPGMRVAVTAGSRGIASIDTVLKAVIDKLKGWEVRPFIIPAMGSHGGATPEGQEAVLASYNITEDTMGVPIESSMEVVQLGATEHGVPLYFSKPAYEADGVLVVNRVKPHTDYRGSVESGMLKMAVIGLGKHKGATHIHKQGFHEFHWLVPDAAQALLPKVPITCGIGLVENGYEELMRAEAVTPDEMETADENLLQTAIEVMPRILFDHLDLLIVDEIGKNISGAGMDPNVTGRFSVEFIKRQFDVRPKVEKIAVLGLSEATHGNAMGIGAADVTTRRVFEAIDLETTYANVITATILRHGAIPLILDNDKEALVVALKTCNKVAPHEARVVRIKNTREMQTIQISEAMLNEARDQEQVEVIQKLGPMAFDRNGMLQ